MDFTYFKSLEILGMNLKVKIVFKSSILQRLFWN